MLNSINVGKRVLFKLSMTRLIRKSSLAYEAGKLPGWTLSLNVL